MTQPPRQPLPVVPILGEVLRLHWRHILLLFAVAALYAVPVTLMLTPMADTLAALQAKQTPELIERFASQGGNALIVILPLSAALFWFWVRLTLMGTRAAWRGQSAGQSLLAIAKLAVLLTAAVMVAAIGIFPATLILGLLGETALSASLTFMVVTFGTCLSFAVFSRRLVETALELPRNPGQPKPAAGIDQHLRLAAVFAAVTFGVFVVQTAIDMALTSIGATLSAQIVTGILSTATITIYASIHAIVYRLRTVPPIP
jgi:hypothetical protein